MTPASIRTENLALIFQEIFTVIVRLRANRQSVPSPDTFRAQMREALRIAGDTARRSGYSSDQTRLAILAVVALLDETVLNSGNPVFQDWPRRPMQEELFGGHVAGETFYQTLRSLLASDDSHEVADLLEVFELCLLLGYQGRYSAGGAGDLQVIRTRVAEKIARIRESAAQPELWQPPEEAPAPASTASAGPVAFVAFGLAALTLLLFVLYRWFIISSIANLAAFVAVQGSPACPLTS